VIAWFLASHLVTQFAGGGLLKLFLGNLKSDAAAAWKWLTHPLTHLIIAGLACIIVAQHFTLIGERRHSAKVELQLSKEHAGRLADRQAYTRAQADAAALNKVHVQQIETKQQKVTTDVETDYQRKLAALRSGLRAQPPAAQGSANGAGSSKVPDASSGPDAEAGVPLSDSERLRAAENELQLDELITWIEQQTKIDPNAEPLHTTTH